MGQSSVFRLPGWLVAPMAQNPSSPNSRPSLLVLVLLTQHWKRDNISFESHSASRSQTLLVEL